MKNHVRERIQACVPPERFDLIEAAMKNKMKPRLFFMISPQTNACDYYRATMVARAIDSLDLFTVRFVHQLTAKEAYEADLMICYRPKDPGLMDYALGQGSKLMVDYDDDVFCVPSSNFLKPNFSPQDKQTSRQVTAGAGQLTTSTRRLRTLLSSNPRASVIPNAADMRSWGSLLMRNPKRKKERYRIGWAGTYTHTEDIIGSKFLAALDAFMTERRDVEMVFFGFCPEDFMNKFWGRVTLVEPVNLYHYMPMLASLDLDLMVYPLARHQFNYSKSNIRWLESSALHVPIIASDIPSYADVGADLCMTVEPKLDAWSTALEYAYTHRAEMRERAVRSREWITSHWSIDAMAPAWASVFLSAVEGQHVAQDFTPPTYGVVPSTETTEVTTHEVPLEAPAPVGA